MQIKINSKGYFAIFLFVATLISLLYLGAVFTDDPVIGPLLSLVLASLLSIGTLLFDGTKHWLNEFAKKNIYGMQDDEIVVELPKFNNSYRVCLYGLPGSGKTFLIKSLLSALAPRLQLSTDEYDVYENEVTINLKPLIKQSVAIADYKGDKTSQIKVNPPEDFFGAEDDRKINAILFVVDMFPRIEDRVTKIPLTPEKTKEFVLSEYKQNGLRKIKNRIQETEDYMTKWAIEEIFTVAYSKNNLNSVRLVINKHDLIRVVVEAGYISGVSSDTLESFALKSFSKIEKRIREACKINDISDFSVCILSAATKDNIDSILRNVFSKEEVGNHV